MSGKWKIGLAVTGLVAGAGALLAWRAARERKVTEVLTARVETRDVVAKVTANGKIQAERKVEMSALVMGQIVNLAVREGERVKAGQLLLQIDPNRASAEEASSAAALQATLAERDSARTAVAQSELDFDRARRNYQAAIVSEAEFQRARSALDAARAALAAADNRVGQHRATLNAYRDTLRKTTVLAPIDGVVTELRVKAGEVTVLGTMNNPGTRLMTIADMASVLAVLMVDETDMPAVQLGQRALLSLDSYPDRTFDGEVSEVGNSPIARDDPELTGLATTSDAINFKVRVKMLAPPPTILPGFSVTADVITGTAPQVPVVPLAAVVVRDSPGGKRTASGRLKTQQGVYLFEDGRARFVPIATGLAGDLMVQVKSGLAPGQEIVRGPFQALRKVKDGDRVRRMPEKKRQTVEDEEARAGS